LLAVSSIKIMYKKLTSSQIKQYYATEGKKANPLSPLDWLAQTEKKLTPLNTPEKTLTPLGEDKTLEAPQDKTLPTGASPLTDFAETLSKVTDLARQKRNRMTMELLGERFDPSAEPASGFAGILSDINIASRDFSTDVLERAFPEEEKLNTQVIDVGGRKLLINKLTGETIKDLGVVSIDKKLTPTAGFFDTKIESSVREDANQLLTETPNDKENIFNTLRRLYSPQEATDEAIKQVVGIVEPPITEPTAEDIANDWLLDFGKIDLSGGKLDIGKSTFFNKKFEGKITFSKEQQIEQLEKQLKETTISSEKLEIIQQINKLKTQ